MPLFQERSGQFSPEKTLFLVASILPAVWLVGLAANGGLGARPWTEAIHFTGLWAIRFLAVTLAITPLRRLLFLPKLYFGRRIFGLAALGYAALHLVLFCLDQGFGRALSEIVLRIYLTIGAVAVALLVALGATSFDGAIRRLGAERWNRLHAAVYGIAVLAAVHFFLQTKLDVSEPVLMAGLFLLLFAYRIAARLKGEVTPAVMAGLAVICALITAAIEIAWYGLATRVDPWRVAEANLFFDLGPRPAWWVLAVGLAIAALAASRADAAPKRGRARTPPASRVEAS
ncbi:protein-methionine-sulfoxide reductase heme-binding subunit MsrQ [Xanthobacter sp. KR7-65]|uniref:sulfite oxidase heme-binding subunit YedZ n=1 Tax=Xanthobacter sp. KR7-65 TaxID=3156612 RepID=UPI0032B585F9